MLIVVALFSAGCGNSNEVTGNAVLTCDEYKTKLDSCITEKDIMKEYITKLETGNSGSELKINLGSWKINDIPPELIKLDPDLFAGTGWIYYEYTAEGKLFDVNGPIYGDDPFYDLRYIKYERTRQREYNVSHFRIFPATSMEFQEYSELIEKNDIKDADLTCKSSEGCNGIKIIECHAFGKLFMAWYSEPYLFITREESFNPIMIKVFEEFYC